jgi:predicted transcriptional regulator
MAGIPTEQLVRELFDELPDDCTIEDVHYRLHALDAVARGEADLAAGRGIRHADVVADLGRRRGKNRTQQAGA